VGIQPDYYCHLLNLSQLSGGVEENVIQS